MHKRNTSEFKATWTRKTIRIQLEMQALLFSLALEIDKEINLQLEAETLSNDYMKSFRNPHKLKSLALSNCSTNQDLDLRHFTHLKEVFIEIHFDVSISDRPIEILLPETLKTRRTMYYTENMIILNNRKNAYLPDGEIHEITFLQLIDVQLDVHHMDSLKCLPNLQSLEMIGCYGNLPSALKLEFQNSKHLKKVEIMDCYYDINVFLPKNLEEFNVLLYTGYNLHAIAGECIALKKVTLNIGVDRVGSLIFHHPNVACIEHFDSQGPIMLLCDVNKKKEDWTAKFKKPAAGEWIKTYQLGHGGPIEVICSCECTNLIEFLIEDLMSNLLGDIRNWEF